MILVSLVFTDCPDPCNLVYGCTDPNAENYDANATCDNGACYFINQEIPTYCIGPVQHLDICLDMDNISILDAVSTFDCSINITEQQCINYVPLPGLEVLGMDTIHIDYCSNITDDCNSIIVAVNIGDCGGSLTPITKDDQAMTINESITIDLTANDSDPDGNYLDFCLQSGDGMPNMGGSVIFNDDGTVNYTPPSNFSGIDVFSYTVCDATGNNSTALVYVTVENPNACFNDVIHCVKPFPADVSEVCFEFCNSEIGYDNLSYDIYYFSCSINADANCFTFRPLPGFNQSNVLTVEGCTPDGSVCETVNIVFEVSSDCPN